MVECVLYVNRIPENDSIRDQAQRAELVFLAFTVTLADFTTAPVTNFCRYAVATLRPVQLCEYAPAIDFVVNVGE
jgi:hypothetical protein